MIAIYICVPLAILITLIVFSSKKEKKRKYTEWLLELNQWEVNDAVELIHSNDRYFDVSDNATYCFCLCKICLRKIATKISQQH